MTFNACQHCGRINETATIRANKLVEKMEKRLYLWKHSEAENIEGKWPTSDEIWFWKEELKALVKEL